jgi:hypothetical protein
VRTALRQNNWAAPHGAGLLEPAGTETKVFINTTISTGSCFVLSNLKIKLPLVVVMSAVEMWKGAMAPPAIG